MTKKLPFNLLSDEKIIREIKPSLALKKLFIIKGTLIGLLFIMPFLLGAFASSSSDVLFISIIGIAAIFTISALISENAYSNKQYWITSKRIIDKHGVLGYTVWSIPLERISDVIVTHTFLENLFGIAGLKVGSLAGQISRNNGSEGSLQAVENPEELQEVIFDLLTKRRKEANLTM